MDRAREASEEVRLAWERRSEGKPYVRQRIYFLQVLLALLSGSDASEALRNLRIELQRPDIPVGWGIEQLLKHVKNSLTPDANELLEVMSATINDRAAMKNLETLPAWRAIV